MQTQFTKYLLSWLVAAAVLHAEVKIDFVCFKKVYPSDPGTIHIFLNNKGEQEARIARLVLNEKEVEEGEKTDDVFWWTQVPNTILPGKSGILMIKTARPLALPIKVGIVLNTGDTLEETLHSLTPEFFRIASVSFDLNQNKIYVYLENKFPNRTVEIKDILIDGRNVRTQIIKRLGSVILPGEKDFFICKGLKTIVPGQYITIKITTEEGFVTGALARAYSYFPIQDFGGDKRKELFFNEDTFDMHFPGDEKKFNEYRKEPSYKVYHLLDDPVCSDERKGYLGAMAREVITRRKTCYEKDSGHPTLIYICEYSKPLGYFVYGELADVIAVDPYELTFYNNPPEKDGEYVAIARRASAPRPVVAIPEAFRCISPKFPVGSKRFPTPEEERLLVYSEIAAGAKGLWYYVSYGQNGYKNNPELEKEIGRINREIQFLRDFLVVGEPMDIVKTDSQSVKADALFCGDRGIVIILRNGDYRTIKDKENDGWKTIVENPGKISITLNLPGNFPFSIESIKALGKEGKEVVLVRKDMLRKKVVIEKEMTEIAEPILVKFREEK